MSTKTNLKDQFNLLARDNNVVAMREFLRLNPGTKSIYGNVDCLQWGQFKIIYKQPSESREELEEFKLLIDCLTNSVAFNNKDVFFWKEFLVKNFDNYFASRINEHKEFLLYILQQNLDGNIIENIKFTDDMFIKIFNEIKLASLSKNIIIKLLDANLSRYCNALRHDLVWLINEAISTHAAKKFQELKTEYFDKRYFKIAASNQWFYLNYKDSLTISMDELANLVIMYPELIKSVPYRSFNVANWFHILSAESIYNLKYFENDFLNKCEILGLFTTNKITSFIYILERYCKDGSIVGKVLSKYTTGSKFKEFNFNMSYNMDNATVDEVAGYLSHNSIDTSDKLKSLIANNLIHPHRVVDDLLATLLVNHTKYFMNNIDFISNLVGNSDSMEGLLFSRTRNTHFVAAVRTVLQRKDLKLTAEYEKKLHDIVLKIIL